jgi:hypothetical protein
MSDQIVLTTLALGVVLYLILRRLAMQTTARRDKCEGKTLLDTCSLISACLKCGQQHCCDRADELRPLVFVQDYRRWILKRQTQLRLSLQARPPSRNVRHLRQVAQR